MEKKMKKLIITAMVILVAAYIEPQDVDVDVSCPECEDCLITVEEGKDLLKCLDDGGTLEECFDVYLDTSG